MSVVQGSGQQPSGLRVRLGLAYDGTEFLGWAKQPGKRTVEGELEIALERLFRRVNADPIRLTVAGRTDAGVHATGQVAHLDLTAAHEAQLLAPQRGHEQASGDAAAMLRRRLNGMLGSRGDLAVSSAEFVSLDFEARFSALWRKYEYRIADRATPQNPLRRHDTVHLPQSLNVAAMQAAADTVLGLNDFATFCRARPFATTIRELQLFDWRRAPDGAVVATIQADAFCHSMVRALVGGCVAAGLNRIDATELGALQRAAVRTHKVLVMPAHGLRLVEVGYPPAQDWGIRAEHIRARRSLD